MSTKIITFDDHFATGEPTVQLVATRGRDGRALREATSLHKIASTKSPALEYIKHIEPEPGKTTVLVIGLGDSETYGSNRNGDAFPSEPVPGKISADEVLTKHYQSYDNAHVFEHHVNNDPRKAIGRVKKAFWNPYMRRVEVLEDFDHAKAPHLLEKIANGEYGSKSMGCFAAGTQITMRDGSRKAIEDIAVNDMVMTHLGRARRVTELHRRTYKGPVYKMRGEALESITATAEHPFYVTQRHAVQKKTEGGFRWRTRATVNGEWIHASCIDPSKHMLLSPIPQETYTPDYVNRAFARLFGYYMAEGHIVLDRNKQPYAIQLSTHVDDVVHTEIEDLCVQFGTRNMPHSYGTRATEKSRSVLICDPLLARLCLIHGGKGARTKQFSADVLLWDVSMQREMLGAFANGDGHSPARGAQKGTLKLSTCNRELGDQWVAIASRMGLVPSVNCLTHKAGKGFSTCATREYVLHFGKAYAQSLRDVCQKIVVLDAYTEKYNRKAFGQYVAVPIRELHVEERELDVYNFEVEQDESYVAGWVGAHNCRIKYDVCTLCGNKAKTRKDYCDQLKFEMRKVLPDGRKIAALNPSPQFFDSSWVIRPADRTGFMLKKVAFDAPYNIRSSSFELGELVEGLREKAAAASKAAAMEKVISGEPTATSSGFDNGSLKLLKRYSDEVAPNEAKKLPGLSSEGVKITIEYSPDEAIGTTDAMGLPMGLKDLIQFFMGRLGSEPAKPEELDAVSKQASVVFDIFAAYPRFFDDMVKAANLEEPKVNTKVANHVWPQAYNTLDRNLEDSPLYDRRVTSSLTSAQTPNTDVVSYTDPAMNTHVSNMGLARRATESLANDAQVSKGVRGAGYLGMGTLLGAAATGTLLGKGGRSPLRRLAGGALGGAAAVTAGKGIHEAARPVRLSDLNAPMLLSNEGQLIPATTEMSYQKKGSVGHTPWNPEMLYTTLRHADGGARAVAPAVKTALFASLVPCEIWDESASILGPTLDMSKVAMLLEDTLCISPCA